MGQSKCKKWKEQASLNCTQRVNTTSRVFRVNTCGKAGLTRKMRVILSQDGGPPISKSSCSAMFNANPNKEKQNRNIDYEGVLDEIESRR